MVIDLHDLLSRNPALVFFLVLGLGALLGNARAGSLRLGATAGVLLAGLILGHMGYQGPSQAMELGFILFMYSVGLQAGPRFFSVVARDGLKYAALALVTAVTAFFLARGLGAACGFSNSLTAGLMAGSLTSTPALAAAQDAVRSGLARLAEGVTQDAAIAEIGVGYAITYIFGMLGVMLCIKTVPRLWHADLAASARAAARERGMPEEGEEEAAQAGGRHMIRVFEAKNAEVLGRTLREIGLPGRTGCVVQEIKRQARVFFPDAETRIEPGDRVAVAGEVGRLEELSDFFGPGVFDRELVRAPIETATVVVTHADAVGKHLSDLHILARSGCFVTRLVRAQIELPPRVDVLVERGDLLTLAGLTSRLRELVKTLGHVERDIVQTDILTFALGIAAGIVLGKFTIRLGSVSLGLGMSGGLLASGILIGFVRSLHPTFGRVPPAAAWVVRELGILFFMAGIGLSSGGGIVAALSAVGLPLFASGVAVTLVPFFVAFLFGRYVLRLNMALLLGGITGSMTSTPSLALVTAAAASGVPALGYAGAYAFANVFKALSGTLLMIF